MALTADKSTDVRTATTHAFTILNGTTVFAKAKAAVNGPSFATAASRGKGVNFDDVAGTVPLGGLFQKQIVGDDALLGSAPLDPQVEQNVSVAGTANDQDIMKPFYMTDENTYTLTRPTLGIPLGVIFDHITGTTCDVYHFGFDGLSAIALGGNGQELMYLGSFDADTITAADIRTGIPMPYHGAFLEVFAMIDIAPTGASGTADINLEIGATNVTGGVVTVATGDAKAAKKDGTAITAENVFHEGDLLDIEAATVTDMTAGRFDLFAIVERRIGV